LILFGSKWEVKTTCPIFLSDIFQIEMGSKDDLSLLFDSRG
jgi:hypothetical protein